MTAEDAYAEHEIGSLNAEIINNLVVNIIENSWVGLKWFRTFFNMPRFWQIVKNTLTISLYSLIAGFPIPVILALMINSVRNTRFQKVTQTITYMPHFISVVILVGMLTTFLSPRSGFLSHILTFFGASEEAFLYEIDLSDENAAE